MHNEEFIYRTLAKTSDEVLLKEKKSKFLAQAFPVNSETEIKSILENLKTIHSQSNHICYAWQLGIGNVRYRANDDGEPNNSAGMPIYGQIQSFGLTNVLVTVTRYFGGTKLGVGGLIYAYRESAKMTLNTSSIIEKHVEVRFELLFPYSEMNKVMRIIKQNSIKILHQKMELECRIKLLVAKNKADQVFALFDLLQKVKVEKETSLN